MRVLAQQAVTLPRVKRYTPKRAAYSYRADRRMRWLQRLCFWVLKKLDATDLPQRELSFEVHEMNPAVTEKLHHQIGECLRTVRRHYGRRPERLYIGSDDWREITDNPVTAVIMDRLKFRAPRDEDDEGLVLEPYDIRIVVVPWMKGWVLL